MSTYNRRLKFVPNCRWNIHKAAVDCPCRLFKIIILSLIFISPIAHSSCLVSLSKNLITVKIKHIKHEYSNDETDIEFNAPTNVKITKKLSAKILSMEIVTKKPYLAVELSMQKMGNKTSASYTVEDEKNFNDIEMMVTYGPANKYDEIRDCHMRWIAKRNLLNEDVFIQHPPSACNYIATKNPLTGTADTGCVVFSLTTSAESAEIFYRADQTHPGTYHGAFVTTEKKDKSAINVKNGRLVVAKMPVGSYEFYKFNACGSDYSYTSKTSSLFPFTIRKNTVLYIGELNLHMHEKIKYGELEIHKDKTNRDIKLFKDNFKNINNMKILKVFEFK